MGGITSSSVQPYDGDIRTSPPKPVVGKVTQTEIQLSWEDAFKKVRGQITPDPEAGYLKVCLQRCTEKGDWTDLNTDSVDGYTDANLDPGKTYTYRMKFKHRKVESEWSSHVEVSSEHRAITSLNVALEDEDAAKTVKVLRNFPLDELDVTNIQQYQEALRKGKSTPSHHLNLNDVLLTVKKVNGMCATAAINRAVNQNNQQGLILALQNPNAGILNVHFDKAEAYLILLCEAKEEQASSVDGEVLLNQLSAEKIQSTIRNVNSNFITIMCNVSIDREPPGVILEMLDRCGVINLKSQNGQQYKSELLIKKSEKNRWNISNQPRSTYSLGYLETSELQQTINQTNLACAVLALNKAIDENLSEVTPGTIRETEEHSYGIKEQLIDEYRIILKETKDNQRKNQTTQPKQANRSKNSLQTEDIANTISLVNRWWLYIRLDGTLQKGDKQDSLAQLRQLRLSNFEDENTDDYYSVLEDRMKNLSRERTNKGVSRADTGIFHKRLTRDEIQGCIDKANTICAVRAINESVDMKDEKETDKTLWNKYADIQNLRRNMKLEYFTVLQNAKNEKKSGSSFLEKESIQTAIDDYNWLHSINKATDQKNAMKVLAAMDNGSVSYTNNSDSNGYVQLLWEAQIKKRRESQENGAEGIFKDILTKQEIREVVLFHPLLRKIDSAIGSNGNIVSILEKKDLKLKSNISTDDNKCYVTLMKKAKEAKTSSNWGWPGSSNYYDDKLTHCEVEDIVEEFWRVKAVNDTLEKSDAEAMMGALERLQSFTKTTDWGDTDCRHKAEYHVLLQEHKNEKKSQKMDNSWPGFEKLLTRDEIHCTVCILHPRVLAINLRLQDHLDKEPEEEPKGSLRNIAISNVQKARQTSAKELLKELKLLKVCFTTTPAWTLHKEGEIGYLILLARKYMEKRKSSSSDCRLKLQKGHVMDIAEEHSRVLEINRLAEDQKETKKINDSLNLTCISSQKIDDTDQCYQIMLKEALSDKKKTAVNYYVVPRDKDDDGLMVLITRGNLKTTDIKDNLLQIMGSPKNPFRIEDIRSLDNQRTEVVICWCEASQADRQMYGGEKDFSIFLKQYMTKLSESLSVEKILSPGERDKCGLLHLVVKENVGSMKNDWEQTEYKLQELLGSSLTTRVKDIRTSDSNNQHLELAVLMCDDHKMGPPKYFDAKDLFSILNEEDMKTKLIEKLSLEEIVCPGENDHELTLVLSKNIVEMKWEEKKKEMETINSKLQEILPKRIVSLEHISAQSLLICFPENADAGPYNVNTLFTILSEKDVKDRLIADLFIENILPPNNGVVTLVLKKDINPLNTDYSILKNKLKNILSSKLKETDPEDIILLVRSELVISISDVSGKGAVKRRVPVSKFINLYRKFPKKKQADPNELSIEEILPLRSKDSEGQVVLVLKKRMDQVQASKQDIENKLLELTNTTSVYVETTRSLDNHRREVLFYVLDVLEEGSKKRVRASDLFCYLSQPHIKSKLVQQMAVENMFPRSCLSEDQLLKHLERLSADSDPVLWKQMDIHNPARLIPLPRMSKEETNTQSRSLMQEVKFPKLGVYQRIKLETEHVLLQTCDVKEPVFSLVDDVEVYERHLSKNDIQAIVDAKPILSQMNDKLMCQHLKNPKAMLYTWTELNEKCFEEMFREAKKYKKELQFFDFLTHRDTQNIINVQDAVRTVNKMIKQDNPEATIQALRNISLGFDLKEYIRSEEVRGYHVQLKEELDLKSLSSDRLKEQTKCLQEIPDGFEDILTYSEIKAVVNVHPQILEMNDLVENFSKALKESSENDTNKQGDKQQGDDEEAEVKKIHETHLLGNFALKLKEKLKKAMQHGIWTKTRDEFVGEDSKGYLKLFLVRLMEKKKKPSDCLHYLTKKEIQLVVRDWKAYEGFADFLISRTHSDEDCVVKLKKVLGTTSPERVASYRYRIEDDAGGKASKEGDDEEELWGHSHLHLAICFRKLKTAALLAERVPALIDQDIGTFPDNRKKYLGLTPFHIAVGHGLGKLVEIMLTKCSDDQIRTLFYVSQKCGKDNMAKGNDAVGRRMKGTVFMGQLPLHVAALSFVNENNKDDNSDEIQAPNRYLKVLEILFDNDRVKKLWNSNYLGDTVFHTLMRFVRCFPGDEPNAVIMMKYLDGKLSQKTDSQKNEAVVDKRAILFQQNLEKKTALQMATEFGHTELFRYMMGMKGIYQIVLPHDDIYEIRRFDVTEIDKVALMETLSKTHIQSKQSTDSNRKDTSNEDSHHEYLPELLWHKRIVPKQSNQVEEEEKDIKKPSPSQNTSQQSVSELLCCQALSIGIKMIQADVFETILRRKWSKYKYIFYPFFAVHALLLILMCVYASAKASAVENDAWAPGGFLFGCNIVSLFCSLLYFCQEVPLRLLLAKQPLAITAVHHNIIYRVMMVLFAVCLFFDSILNLALPTMNNWFLLFGLVFGTWLLLFFLRIHRFFSVYIVLINEGLFKTVLPFAVLIMLQVFVFSVCMHTIFLHPEPQAEEGELSDFETFGKSLLMMGKLMIGLTELEYLLSSREDVLAIIFFAIFVLLTFLLMINALIGVLTNRFQDTQLNKQQVVYLQKLSVIIFIEGWVLGLKPLVKFAVRCGRKPKKEEGQDENERFILSYRKIPSSMADNPDNIEHALRKDRKKLDEISGKVDTMLEYQTARAYDGMRVLKIFDYSRRY